MIHQNGASAQASYQTFSGFQYFLSQGIHCVKTLPASHKPIEKYKQGDWSPRTQEQAQRDDRALREGRIGIEILCGKRSGVIALDIETTDEWVLGCLPDSACKRKGVRGETRFFRYNGETNKRYYCLRTGVLLFEVLSDNGENTTPHLCAVPPSIHPSGVPYEWIGEGLKVEILEELTGIDDTKFRVEVGGRTTGEEASEDGVEENIVVDATEIEVVKAALEKLNPACSYPDWRNVAYGLRDKMGAGGKELFIEWSAKCKEKFEKAETVGLIENFFSNGTGRAGVNKIGFGTVLKMAKDAGYGAEDDKKALIAGLGELEVKGEGPVVVNGTHKKGEGESIDGDKINYKQHPYQVAREYIKSPIMRVDRHWWKYEIIQWRKILTDLAIDGDICEFIKRNGFNRVPIPKNTKKKEVGSDDGYYNCVNIRGNDLLEVRNNVGRLVAQMYEPTANAWLDADRRKKQPNIIPVSNGLLDVETCILHPFTPEFFNTSVLPMAFDPTAQCPVWLEALDTYFLDEPWVGQELKRYVGYCLLSSINQKKILCLAGPTDSGKTTIMDIISSLFGPGYVKACNKAGLQSQFGLSGLEHSKLMVLEEYSLDKLNSKEVEVLKAITGGGDIAIDRKYESPITTRVNAKVIMTTNTTPERFHDHGQALQNRMMFLVCNRIPEKRHTFLAEIENEMSGILNWALEGATEILSGAILEQPKGRGAAFHAEFVSAGRSPLQAFLQDACSFDQDAKPITMVDLYYDKFKQFCEDENYPIEPSNLIHFSRRIRDTAKEYSHLNGVLFDRLPTLHRQPAAFGLRVSTTVFDNR